MSNQSLEHARNRIRQLREDVKIAGAELHLAHEALLLHLPAQARQGDVAWAIGQNAVVEHKLQLVAEELDRVAELLHPLIT